ncbi:MAG: phosphotriesterase [Gammaproteobacteria bacterium]
MTTINTVTGTITPDQLGRTMMHEHLVVASAGWEADTAHPGLSRSELLALCVDRIGQLKGAGVRSFVDPCPGDIGRDVELAAEVSVRTGMQIVAATGLFNEVYGGSQYWKSKVGLGLANGLDAAKYMAEVFIRELTVGIGSTGIKAGIIKVATDRGRISDYERVVLHAAAIASLETGAPITTHTQQGELGREQQQTLTGHGVPAHRIVIGHSDGSPDFEYHTQVAGNGSYLGFDRFGWQTGDFGRPDPDKVQSLVKLIRAGWGGHVVVSCDHVCAYRGSVWPQTPVTQQLIHGGSILHYLERIQPMLREAEVPQADIDRLTIENPRRYFAGIPVSRP